MIYNVVLLSLHSESVEHSESVIHRKDFFIGAFQPVKIIIITFIRIKGCFFLWTLLALPGADCSPEILRSFHPHRPLPPPLPHAVH